MNGTVLSAFAERAALHGDNVAIELLAAGGAPADRSVTWREWYEESAQFARALIAHGVNRGDAIAIFAGNEIVWPVADLAALRAGIVSVGIYPTSAPAQVRVMLESCAARLVVVGNAKQLAAVAEIANGVQDLTTVVLAAGVERNAELPAGIVQFPWNEWMADNAQTSRELAAREAAVTLDDLAILIYTSGSTGIPKGARITHRNITASGVSIAATLGTTSRDRSLAFLPFSHAAERIFGMYTRIMSGITAGLVPDHTQIWQAARAFRPTIFGGLPRFYEKVYGALQAERAAADAEGRKHWDRVLELGTSRSRLVRVGLPVPAEHDAEWHRLLAPLHKTLQAHFGGAVRVATSGGAALPPDVGEFLDALGLTVLGAYGMTEHLCAAFHRHDNYDFASVGVPMRGTELQIAHDGEILIRRCSLTFDGYYNDAEATAAAFTDDGVWLRTGDNGHIDARGRLHVTGRSKELIALSTGKKVAPLPIEARLVQAPWISQAMLYGEGRSFITALITLRRAVLEAWATALGIAPDWDSLVEHPDVHAGLQRAIDQVNSELSNPEQIRKFVVIARDLSAETDELTPTLKLRRDIVASRFHAQLDSLYGR